MSACVYPLCQSGVNDHKKLWPVYGASCRATEGRAIMEVLHDEPFIGQLFGSFAPASGFVLVKKDVK